VRPLPKSNYSVISNPSSAHLAPPAEPAPPILQRASLPTPLSGVDGRALKTMRPRAASSIG